MDVSEVYPADAMAAPLRKVSSYHHQTLRRMGVTCGLPLRLHRDSAVVPLRVPNVRSDRSTPSSHATPFRVSLYPPSLVYNFLKPVSLAGDGHCSRREPQ